MTWNEDFSARVNFAAAYIGAGTATTRRFDSCFENDDGDAVVTALYRRAQLRPLGRLAANLWRYVARDSAEPVAIANAGRNLLTWAHELRHNIGV